MRRKTRGRRPEKKRARRPQVSETVTGDPGYGEDFPEEIEWYPIEGHPAEEVPDGLQAALGEQDDFFE